MENRSYPSIPEKNWWQIRDQFKKTLPTSVSATYLKSLLGLTSEKSAMNLISPLKQFGLIDSEGRPTERANEWRNDEKYPLVCDAIIEEIYPMELRDLFPNAPVDSAAAAQWFMDANRLGGGAAKKAASMFCLLRSKTIRDTNHPTTQTKSHKSAHSTIKKRSNRKEAAANVAKTASKTEVCETPIVAPKEPSVHIDLQIHISPESSLEQIDQVFASISKHLYHNE